MSDEQKNGSAEAGSPEAGNAGPQTGQPDDTGKTGGPSISKAQYEALEKRLGEQGQELGDYRSFVKNITPLLDKLDAQPEVIQAILDGKIDSELAKAAMEGKINVEDAQKVSDAHDKVKKDMGTKYDSAAPADIEKRIEAEFAKARSDFDKKLKESEERRAFQDSVSSFIGRTPDFPEYAEEVEKLVLENPKIDDIELAYNVVKGKKLQAEAAKKSASEAGEAAKNMAANAGGGSSQGGQFVSDQDTVDKLIAHRSNPNLF